MMKKAKKTWCVYFRFDTVRSWVEVEGVTASQARKQFLDSRAGDNVVIEFVGRNTPVEPLSQAEGQALRKKVAGLIG